MSADTVITVEGLSKAYLLGHQEKHDTLLGSALSLLKSPVTNLRDLRKLNTSHLQTDDSDDPDILWALRDVSFEIKRGEVLGIIGRNGAGKSTLLKILAHIAEPTRGRVTIRGRVSALLEVGTGFHPELTGRENIYLNGTILGMRKAEIDRKFDEIVDFSGIERFLDTPVKRYSSGMKVRLAFAVAAHLDPEILIVDEVLAVGDAEFQKKCLGKMQDVSEGEGRTVLFVSHNLPAIQVLTERCACLADGILVDLGPTSEVVEAYSTRNESYSFETEYDNAPRRVYAHGAQVRILRIIPRPENGSSFPAGGTCAFDVEYRSLVTIDALRIGMTVLDDLDTPVMSSFSGDPMTACPGASAWVRVTLTDSRLAPGCYRIAMSLVSGSISEARTTYDVVRPGPAFRVAAIESSGSVVYEWQRSYGSVIHPMLEVLPLSPGRAV